MYASDSFDRVQQAARLFSDDSRVTQFFDPGRVLGRAVAEGLGAKPTQIAWDVYLFYDRNEEWLEQLPTPTEWVHQLRGSDWAESDRLFRGDRLAPKLREIAKKIIHN